MDGLLWRTVAELRTEVCQLVGSGLSKTEGAPYAAGIRYRNRCPLRKRRLLWCGQHAPRHHRLTNDRDLSRQLDVRR